jgi:RecB family endonuclease NucS
MPIEQQMNYRTIKELVIRQYESRGEMPPYEELTALVREHFPNSRWKETHYAWYKSQIKTGRIAVTTAQEVEESEDLDAEVERAIEARVSLERDLHEYLARNLASVEPGLRLRRDGLEFQTAAGRIDILAVDSRERPVVIEVKAGRASDSALGQLLGYVGCLAETPRDVRGILVAFEFDDRVMYATRALPNVQLVKYAVNFRFDHVSR